MNVLAKAEAGVTHDQLANAIRFLAIDAVEAANSGHPGMPMGMADVATILFTQFLKFDAADPAWPDRDRFVLSAGHGSMLLYALLYLTGYPEMTIEEIKRFRQLGSKTPGHPEYGHTPGVETTTGPLGQGLATAVGMAIAEKLLAARYGGEFVDHRTYVIAGDGCLMEGVSQEAITLAGHLKLGKLIVLWDNNNITIDGAVSLSDSTDQVARFKAAGWDAWHIDGHDPQEIAAALSKAQNSDRPVLIACKTQIGFGAPNKAGTHSVHGAALGAPEVAAAREKLGWTAPAFEIPEPILAAWRASRARGNAAREAWKARHLGEVATRFDSEIAGTLSPATFGDDHRIQARRERRQCGAGDACLVAEDARRAGEDPDQPHRRLGRPHRLEQYQSRRHAGRDTAGFLRPLYQLRHPRVRDGGGDERPRAAWRLHSLWRHVPGFRRLCAPGDPPLGADASARHLRADA